MPKTGYLLSEKEVAKVHKHIHKLDKLLVESRMVLQDLESRFPDAPASDSNAVEQQD